MKSDDEKNRVYHENNENNENNKTHEMPVFFKRIIIKKQNGTTDTNDTIETKQKNEKDFETIAVKTLLLEFLPKEIYISTMTTTCKIEDVKFNCENIARYIDLSNDNVRDIICAVEEDGKKKIVYRELTTKKCTKRKKKKKSVFYNQTSIHLNIITKKSDSVHVKLFSNGSMHITGCQSVNDIVATIKSILEILKIDKYIYDEKENKMIEKSFVSDKNKLDISLVTDLKVSMINTNYRVPFKINLTDLYNLMSNKEIECRYDKINHSCVNIKYDHPEKKISVFVFEKGSIVITGAKNGEHVKSAYEFINKFLYTNYLHIVKKDVNILENMNNVLNKYVDPIETLITKNVSSAQVKDHSTMLLNLQNKNVNKVEKIMR